MPHSFWSTAKSRELSTRWENAQFSAAGIKSAPCLFTCSCSSCTLWHWCQIVPPAANIPRRNHCVAAIQQTKALVIKPWNVRKEKHTLSTHNACHQVIDFFPSSQHDHHHEKNPKASYTMFSLRSRQDTQLYVMSQTQRIKTTPRFTKVRILPAIKAAKMR